jgi:hypothetical protein
VRLVKFKCVDTQHDNHNDDDTSAVNQTMNAFYFFTSCLPDTVAIYSLLLIQIKFSISSFLLFRAEYVKQLLSHNRNKHMAKVAENDFLLLIFASRIFFTIEFAKHAILF